VSGSPDVAQISAVASLALVSHSHTRPAESAAASVRPLGLNATENTMAADGPRWPQGAATSPPRLEKYDINVSFIL
jgi:hypothetical protein